LSFRTARSKAQRDLHSVTIGGSYVSSMRGNNGCSFGRKHRRDGRSCGIDRKNISPRQVGE
jgi:hypothetical protein